MRNIVKCKKWLILAAICVLSVLFACTEQIINGVPEAEDLTLTIAKQWYESEYPPIVTTRTTGDSEDEVLMKPDWRGAVASAKGRFETVETPILMNRGHIMMDEETAEHWNPLMKLNFIRNTNRIVILRDKETNKTRSFIMMFIGSYNYLKRGGKMEQNSYLFREPDYDGLVYYYSINGEFINGWRYSNGKIVGYLSPSCDEQNKKEATTRAMQQICRDVCVSEYRTECHDEYYLVSGDIESGYVYDIFTQCYNVPMYNCHQECQWIDDGRPTDPNQPPGGGVLPENPDQPTGEISMTPAKYTHVEGEHLAKKNLPTTMPTQIPNGCVPAIMEYINNKVFGGKDNQGVYLKHYYQTYNNNILQDGVSNDKIAAFTKSFFKTEEFSSYQSAIDKGNVVMTDISSSIAGSTHNVVVVGYQPNGKLIYMDPEKGEWNTAHESYLNKNYRIVITGIK